MHTFSTLVLYERHGRAAIGYRAEMIDQIARGDIAEGSRGAWELRCWTPANESPCQRRLNSDPLWPVIAD